MNRDQGGVVQTVNVLRSKEECEKGDEADFSKIPSTFESDTKEKMAK